MGKLSRWIGTSVVVAAMVSTSAFAWGGKRGMPPQEVMERFDANRNGILEDDERRALKAEMKAKREARRQEALAQFDANRNGQLDPDERTRLREARAAERFKSLDANGDGVLSLEEFQAGKLRHGRRGMHR